MANVTEAPEGAATVAAPSRRVRTPIGTQRVLQVVLGVFWIVDAALQYQPFMFGNQFVSTYITANASGQPQPISWLITNAGHFISPDVAVWNTLFATVQLAIGVGLLFPRTVRPTLVTSFMWVFGVWLFGEGLGGLSWARPARSAARQDQYSLRVGRSYGLAQQTSHRRRGNSRALPRRRPPRVSGGPATPLAVWAGFWLLGAVLFLLPANRVATSVSGSITGMASGEPGWYAGFLNHVGGWFGAAGMQQTWLLAVVSVVVGLGPLLLRRFEIFLAIGALLALLFWVTAQGLGGVLTGSGTDPNTGPLIIILAFAMVPTMVAERSSWVSPFDWLRRRHPALSGAGAVGFLCTLLLAATYPAAAATMGAGTTDMAMSGSSTSAGMSMQGMESGSMTTTAAKCSAGNNGAAAWWSRRDQFAQHGNGNQVRDHDEHERCRRQRGSRSQHDQGQLVLYGARPSIGRSQRIAG